MRFRRTEERDVDRVMQILGEGRASLARLGIDQWQGGYPFRAMIEDDVAAGVGYVVVGDDDVPLATAMIGFHGDETYDDIEQGAWLTGGTSDDPRYVVVHRVATAADATRRGAASLMVAEAARLARERGRESVRIDTHPGNLPMQRMLDKLGFARCGIVRMAHAEGEGATLERVAYEKLV